MVARHAVDWLDRARPDPYAPKQQRELMVHLWYPTRARSGTPAPYVPNAAAINQNPSAQNAAREVYGNLWSRIVAGTLLTHVIEEAPPAPGTYPLILFSPGDSATTFSYTAQIEDLVSYGFIVAAVEHTGMSGLVRFPDGRIRLYGQLPTPSAAAHNAPLQQMIATAEEGTQIAAEDLRFVLDQLATNPLPVARYVDSPTQSAMGILRRA